MKTLVRNLFLVLFAVVLGTAELTHAQTLTIAAEGKGAFHDLRPFEVIDAKGKFVGRLFEPYVVQMEVGAKRYLVELTPKAQGNVVSLTSMAYTEPYYFYFTSDDCTGQPLALVSSGGQSLVSGAPSAITTEDPATGQLLLYPTQDSYTQVTAASARYLPYDNGCQQTSLSSGFVPLLAPIDISSLYTAPFHVR